MSVFIPDQLDQMSKKELLEFAQTAHEENVSLCQQLAKANERIAELESYNVRLANESHEYQQRCAELENDLLRQSVFMEKTAEKLEQHREWQATANVLRRPTRESKQALNKFALEKKVEGMQRVLDCRELNLSQGEVDTIKLMQEQLRKRRNND